MQSLLRIGNADLVAKECEAARRLGYPAIKLHGDHGAGRACRAQGYRRRHPADGPT
jgi:hypothetical protein